MNNIDKVNYISELKKLTKNLEYGSLTLFETAQTKKRLQDICNLFDEPIFQQYLSKKTMTNPVKMIAPYLAQKSTAALRASPKVIRRDIQPKYSNINQDKDIESIKRDIANEESIKNLENKDEIVIPNSENKFVEQILPTENIQTEISIDGLVFPITPINIQNLPSTIYQLSIQENVLHSILVNIAYTGSLTHQPIFIAEETTESQQFTQYIIYMGAESSVEAAHTLSPYCSHSFRKISAIRELIWQQVKGSIFQHEAFFHLYMSSKKVIWQKESYFPFIPQMLITKRKFIFFDEAEANVETPLLFLEERGKNRLICGANRLILNKNELAYPFVTYSRQHGLNWQIIQETITSLPQPIVTLDLWKALNKIIENTKN